MILNIEAIQCEAGRCMYVRPCGSPTPILIQVTNSTNYLHKHYTFVLVHVLSTRSQTRYLFVCLFLINLIILSSMYYACRLGSRSRSRSVVLSPSWRNIVNVMHMTSL